MAGLLVAQTAQAQPTQAQVAAAETLFNEGRALMEAGHYDQGCPKLAESHRLDPASGTLLNLGICYQDAGKTASAWAAFKEAVVLARRDGRPERVAFAEERIAKLEPTLSYLTVSVETTSRVDQLSVRVDGAILGEGAWGTPIPTDPGTHRVEAGAPGRTPWSMEVVLGASSDKKTVIVPLLESEAVAPVAEPVTAVPTRPDPAPPRQSEDEMRTGSNQSTWGYVIGGVGVIGLGLGSFFGAKAISSWSKRNDLCPDGVCSTDAVAYGDDANRYGNMANVGVGLGLLGVGVGTYLVLTAPSPMDEQGVISVEPSLAGGAPGMVIGGAW
jgi:hypothetical protein